MFRSLICLAFALPALAAAVPVAPVPPPTEKELIAKHWGTTEGNGDFTLSGKQLIIRSNGRQDRLSVHDSTSGIPHITRTVTGDSEVTVRVVGASAPNNSVGHQVEPETRAGIFLFAGGEAAELTMSQSGYPDAKRQVLLVRWGGPCAMRRFLADVESSKPTHLRLTRKGETFTAAYSFDGQKWSDPEEVKPFGFTIPNVLTVGVHLVHNTRQIGAHASFDNFTITKPK